MLIPKKLLESMKLKAEESLENLILWVPKVQGFKPNLSGKRTEQTYI